MAKRLMLVVLVVLVGAGVAAPTAEASGGAGAISAPDGVTVGGLPYRYVALPVGYPDKVTAIAKIDLAGGRVDRTWYLDGIHHVPAPTYDGRGGGLSADGGTLVLGQFPRSYPQRVTRFAILDTDLYMRLPRTPGHPRSPGRGPHAITQVNLRGSFGFDAISPDGSTLYLVHYLSPADPTKYEVRAYDLERRRLLTEPVVDPSEPDEQMRGLPITRAASPDGRWAYTLYDGNGKEPFIHALDTVRREAACIDLPQLTGRQGLYMLRLGVEDSGSRLAVLDRPPGPEGSRPLLNVDTETFAVTRAAPAVTESSGGLPAWLAIGLGTGALAAALAWLAARRRRHPVEGAFARPGGGVGED